MMSNSGKNVKDRKREKIASTKFAQTNRYHCSVSFLNHFLCVRQNSNCESFACTCLK